MWSTWHQDEEGTECVSREKEESLWEKLKWGEDVEV